MLSSSTHKMVALFGNVWHTECSCESYLLCVSINKAPPHDNYRCMPVYVLDHTRTSSFSQHAIWFLCSSNDVC